MTPAAHLPPALRDAVLAWYGTNGRRFAIRESTDPYAIFVSEVMAQQTQIGRVAGYWDRWMRLFPTVAALAQARPADVVRAWAGLGYNRRAINLQRAARAMVTEYDGQVPDTVAALERLPGVGPYTARAVAAIAFGRRVGAVDTNVRRVLARVATRDGKLPAADLQALADRVVPASRAKEWTHAVMDVGATFCRPRRPRCDACPALRWCRYARGRENRGLAAHVTHSEAPSEAPFTLSSRWLRGRVIDRLRDVPDGTWTSMPDAIGAHGGVEIAAAISGLARDGLVETDRGDPPRFRLPIA